MLKSSNLAGPLSSQETLMSYKYLAPLHLNECLNRSYQNRDALNNFDSFNKRNDVSQNVKQSSCCKRQWPYLTYIQIQQFYP